MVKNLPISVRDTRDKRCGVIPGSRRFPAVGNGNPFLPGKFHRQKILAATVHWVTKSQTQQSTHTHTHTHTSVILHFLVKKVKFLFKT